jgi:hypothetical protein
MGKMLDSEVASELHTSAQPISATPDDRVKPRGESSDNRQLNQFPSIARACPRWLRPMWCAAVAWQKPPPPKILSGDFSHVDRIACGDPFRRIADRARMYAVGEQISPMKLR